MAAHLLGVVNIKLSLQLKEMNQGIISCTCHVRWCVTANDYIFDTATYNLTCDNHATWAQCYAFIPSVLVRKSVSGNRLAI